MQLRRRNLPRLNLNGGNLCGGAFRAIGQDRFRLRLFLKIMGLVLVQRPHDEVAEVGMHLIEVSLDESFYLMVPSDDHGQRWGLYAADGAKNSVMQGGGPAVVHADQPIQPGARFRRRA